MTASGKEGTATAVAVCRVLEAELPGFQYFHTLRPSGQINGINDLSPPIYHGIHCFTALLLLPLPLLPLLPLLLLLPPPLLLLLLLLLLMMMMMYLHMVLVIAMLFFPL
jgi:hypothetical protein